MTILGANVIYTYWRIQTVRESLAVGVREAGGMLLALTFIVGAQLTQAQTLPSIIYEAPEEGYRSDR